MITVDIVTPNRRLVEGAKAISVKVPAVVGETEILVGHAEMLTLLETGVVTLQLDGQSRNFAISQGFAEVHNDRVLILAETAEESKEIDRERAKRAQKKAEEMLQSVLSDEHFKKYQLKVQRALVRQRISN